MTAGKSMLEFGQRAAADLGRLLRLPLLPWVRPTSGRAWLTLRIDGAVPELDLPPFWGRPAKPGLLSILRALAAAENDPSIAGVCLRIEEAPGSAALAALRRALLALRAAGKRVVVYAEQLDDASLLLASAADRIWLPEAGALLLIGLRVERFYFKSALERVGVGADAVRVGRYKSAADSFVRERMSDEEREMLGALADDLFGLEVEGIAQGRGLGAEAVREAIDGGPYSARAAAARGLIDGCRQPFEVESGLVELDSDTALRDDGRPWQIDLALYAALFANDSGWQLPLGRRPRIAYVVASGLIQRGHSARGIASDVFRALLESSMRDERIRAVVLRLDSPGGDAVASDLLWGALRRVALQKPVVVSIGDVAASGGYYLASAASAILAEAGSLTGSIGVIGGKLEFSGLAAKLGIGHESIARGARADLLSPAQPFDSGQRMALRSLLEANYELFLERVVEGRGRPLEAIRRVAEGRVWSGARACEFGLVDRLGGPLEALVEARQRAGIADGERVGIDEHPKWPPLLRWLPRFPLPIPRRPGAP